MVGVPGRSKACATCRRRKKGCDLKRPSCTQCRRAGLECGGYERGRIFVHSTHNHPLRFSRERTSTPGCSSSSDGVDDVLAASIAATTAAIQADKGAYRRTSTSPGTISSYSSSPVRRPADYRIVPVCFGTGQVQLTAEPRSDSALLGSAREENMLATFWQSYLPNSTRFSRQAAGYASGGWTNVVQALYRKDHVLHYSLMANCFSAMSRITGSRAMAEQSLRAHGRALHQLRLALNQPQKARSDTVFSALRLMIVFSMFFPDRYEGDRTARVVGWREHNLGVLALLQARGPEAHVMGDGHQMFVDCRLPLIIAAIRSRKKTVLNSQPWMTIPWREIPKTPKDQLMDIMAGIPGVLEDVDGLAGWYDENVPIERMQALEKSRSDGPVSTEDLSIIYSMITFYTARLLLSISMRVLAVPDLPPRANLVLCVRMIGRYLRYFFHPSTGQYGLEMIAFPFGICLQTLYSNPHNTDNCEEEKAVFRELAETDRGHEIMEFVGTMLKTFPV
ncbi:fungal transcriptional regulatory protein [Grosmannia clavigera kw1407]|uniref:Fungal transcriptional regulatory protein n=1 Tax=Grosmannia clavigera (strain kw1407 / UAMH 11150) TaxID=655863 RepID=F0XGC6_GROCL|nr:fungal transcriptional regulatory protein [Grosmannia clavigera kw1407]EFX02891.1 fungal transcriptional regulatory protein [Grosmannia clavigera kw1407]